MMTCCHDNALDHALRDKHEHRSAPLTYTSALLCLCSSRGRDWWSLLTATYSSLQRYTPWSYGIDGVTTLKFPNGESLCSPEALGSTPQRLFRGMKHKTKVQSPLCRLSTLLAASAYKTTRGHMINIPFPRRGPTMRGDRKKKANKLRSYVAHRCGPYKTRACH